MISASGRQPHPGRREMAVQRETTLPHYQSMNGIVSVFEHIPVPQLKFAGHRAALWAG
jgi:hypothetical protein